MASGLHLEHRLDVRGRLPGSRLQEKIKEKEVSSWPELRKKMASPRRREAEPGAGVPWAGSLGHEDDFSRGLVRSQASLLHPSPPIPGSSLFLAFLRRLRAAAGGTVFGRERAEGEREDGGCAARARARAS